MRLAHDFLRYSEETGDAIAGGHVHVQIPNPVPGDYSIDDILSHIFYALGFPLEKVPRLLQGRLSLFTSLTSRERVLVLIDGISSEELLEALINRLGLGSALICTSRSRLSGLLGSQIYISELGVLSHEAADAVIRNIVGSDNISANECTELARICNNWPLALMVACKRLTSRKNLTPGELIRRLNGEKRRLRELRVKPGELPVLAAFEVSYRDLGRDVAKAFRRLGLLSPGSFSLKIAAAVLTDDATCLSDASIDEFADLIDELVELNLVEGYAGQRYRLHDLLREYANEKAVEFDAQCERHAAIFNVIRAYLDFVSPFGARLQRLLVGEDLCASEWESALADLELERENLVSAVRTAFDLQMWEQCCLLCSAISNFLDLRNYWKDLRQVHIISGAAAKEIGDQGRQALSLLTQGRAALHLGDVEQSGELLVKSFETAVAASVPSIAAAATHSHGMLWFASGQPEEALRYLKPALKFWRSTDRRDRISAALCDMGSCHMQLSNFDKAERFYRDALASASEKISPLLRATILNNLANLYIGVGRIKDAAEACTESGGLFRSLGDRSGEVTLLVTQGGLEQASGNLRAAENLYETALAVYRKTAEPHGESLVLQRLGSLAYHSGQAPKALELFEEARKISERVGDLASEAVALCCIGQIWGEIGQHSRADQHLQHALRLSADAGNQRAYTDVALRVAQLRLDQAAWEEAAEISSRCIRFLVRVGNHHQAAHARVTLAWSYMKMGEWRRAAEELRIALRDTSFDGDGPDTGELQRNLAIVYARQGLWAESLKLAQSALVTARRFNDRNGEAQALHALAGVYARQGAMETAVTHFQEAISLAKENRQYRLLVAATASLASIIDDNRDYDSSIEKLEASLATIQKLQARDMEGEIACSLGMMRLRRGELDNAETLLQAAAEISQDLGYRDLEARALRGLAGVRRRRQEFPAAFDLLENARTIFHDIEDTASEAETLKSICSLAWEQSKGGDAGLQRVRQEVMRVAGTPAGAYLRKMLSSPPEGGQDDAMTWRSDDGGRIIRIAKDIQEGLSHIRLDATLERLSRSRQRCVVCRQDIAEDDRAELVWLNTGEPSFVWLKLAHPRCGPSAVVATPEKPDHRLHIEVECAILQAPDLMLPCIYVDAYNLWGLGEDGEERDLLLEALIDSGFSAVNALSEKDIRLPRGVLENSLAAGLNATINGDILSVRCGGQEVLSDVPLSFLPRWYRSAQLGLLVIFVGRNLVGMSWENFSYISSAAERGELVCGVARLALAPPAQNHRCVCTPRKGRKFKHCCGKQGIPEPRADAVGLIFNR
ncbi:tetratricopeptide repeat protein [Actinoallomurus acaciae]|uniref:Tetratricopeptide repeat protein n=1 Tax=Actinoallomurus acaciae TaxID=502577 RepID=A0ABV5Y7K9_9ACTN